MFFWKMFCIKIGEFLKINWLFVNIVDIYVRENLRVLKVVC